MPSHPATSTSGTNRVPPGRDAAPSTPTAGQPARGWRPEVALLAASLCLFLLGCERLTGPKISITWKAAKPGLVEVIAPDKDAAPAPPGTQFRGADTRAEAIAEIILTNWKRTALVCGVVLGLILLLLIVIKLLLRLWVVLASVAAGAACAFYGAPLLEARLRAFLPPDIRADLVAYVVAFFAGSLVVSLFLGALLRPLRRGQ